MYACYINKKGMLCAPSGRPFSNPAILFDPDTDVLHKTGEYESIMQYTDEITARFVNIGIQPPKFVTLSLAHLDAENAAYIMRRASEYTASGFLPKLYRAMTERPDTMLQWLAEERQRIVIDVYANK